MAHVLRAAFHGEAGSLGGTLLPARPPRRRGEHVDSSPLPSPASLPAGTSGAHTALSLGRWVQPQAEGAARPRPAQLCSTFPRLSQSPLGRTAFPPSAHLWCTSGQDRCLVPPPHQPVSNQLPPPPWGLPRQATAGEGAPLLMPATPRAYLRGSGRTRSGRWQGGRPGRPAPRGLGWGRWGARGQRSPGCR